MKNFKNLQNCMNKLFNNCILYLHLSFGYIKCYLPLIISIIFLIFIIYIIKTIENVPIAPVNLILVFESIGQDVVEHVQQHAPDFVVPSPAESPSDFFSTLINLVGEYISSMMYSLFSANNDYFLFNSRDILTEFEFLVNGYAIHISMLYFLAYSGIIATLLLVFIFYWPILVNMFSKRVKNNKFILFTMSIRDLLMGPLIVFIVLIMIGVYHHRFLLYYSPLPEDISYYYELGKI